MVRCGNVRFFNLFILKLGAANILSIMTKKKYENLLFAISVILILCVGGCEVGKKQGKIIREIVDSTVEAQTITDDELPEEKRVEGLIDELCNPKRQEFVLQKDPFKPFIIEKKKPRKKVRKLGYVKKEEEPVELEDIDLNGEINYIGWVKLGDEYSALLRSQSGKGIFKKNEKIGEYTIEKIELNRIIFRYGKRKAILEREEKNDFSQSDQ